MTRTNKSQTQAIKG